MNRLFRILLIAAMLWIGTATAGAETVRLTLLHTNDTHGHLLPFNYPLGVPPGPEMTEAANRRDRGGIARRATLVQRIRAEAKNRNTTVWLVDAGDFCEGTPFSIEYDGEADIAAMNAAGYDFATLGNHEFSKSLKQTERLISLADYPILCANATYKADGRPLARAYTIEPVGPLKVALFGLLTRDTGAYPAVRQGVTVSDPVKTAGRIVETLRSQADIIIAISHCGDEVDQRIAESLDAIDVIVGGHSHSRLPSGKFVWHGEAHKEKDVNGTILVQNHQWGAELGRLDLFFEQDEQGVWHVGRYRARLIPVGADIPADPAVAAVVARFWNPIAGRYSEIIGRAGGEFVTLNGDLAEYNLVADAIRAAFQTDFALENIGGVRAPLGKGPITRADLVAMDPFDNTIVTFKMAGAALKRLLRNKRPAVSGIRYRVEGRTLIEATCGGEPVADARIYTGAVNSFIARTWLKGTPVEKTSRRRRDVLIEFIGKQGTILPSYDGRRKVGPLTSR
jgi:5'-nucleotidase / UDP-sugar diphosphatase